MTDERHWKADLCDTEIAPGVRCGHPVKDHIFHGSALLECWRCDDLHHFTINQNPRRRAA